MAASPRDRTTPVVFVVLGILGAAFVALPLVGLITRAPWSRAGEILSEDSSRAALRLSIEVSLLAAGIDLLLGMPLAWLLARKSFAGRTLLRGLVVLPLVMPPVVAGVALLAALGRRGLVGGWLDRTFDLQITFTTGAAVLATAFVSFPLVVLSVEAGLRALDPRLEAAAATMGASRATILRRVTLPLLAPQIVAGVVLAWARALGEFGATLMFAGNLAGRTQTLPLAVFQLSQTDPQGATVLALSLVIVSLGVIVALRRRFLST
ncbi:MAG TPA: molybdate ABC transporter permease subunit [Actinomycetota bacterium]|jgi:molybdate transport system permease protein